MKKLFTIFLLLIANLSMAQTYSIEQDSVAVTVPFADALADQAFVIPALNHLINNTGDTVLSSWNRNIQYMTNGWTSYVCDPNNCYGDATNSADFTFLPSDTAVVYVDFKPHQQSGYGVVRVSFSRQSNAFDKVEATFIGVTDAGTGLATVELLHDAKIFPNPANHQLIIATTAALQVATVEVYNLLGEKMKAPVYQQAETVYAADVNALSSGTYFIKLNLKNGTAVTKRFVKS